MNREGPLGRKTEEPRGRKKAGVGGWGIDRECGRTDGFLNKETVQYRLGRGERKRDGASISVKRTKELGRKEQKEEAGRDREERKEKSRAGKVRRTLRSLKIRGAGGKFTTDGEQLTVQFSRLRGSNHLTVTRHSYHRLSGTGVV